MPLLLAAFVLWAYVFSNFVYKTWYIATAVVLVAMAVLIAKRMVRIDALPRAVAPAALYFSWMLTTAFWAAFPRETLTWLAIDSIGLAVFLLFFLAGRNASARSIVIAVIALTIPAAVSAAIMHALDRGSDPAFTRTAPYVVALLPFVVPFIVLRVMTAPVRWPYRLALAVTFAVLVLGRSRVHFAVAILLLVVSVFCSCEGIRSAFRELVLAAGIVAIAIGALLAAPTTRPAAVAMVSRYLRADVTWGGVEVRAQKRDGTRQTLARLSGELLPGSMPLGIGYMNMAGHLRNATGKPGSLHNMYMTFLLEGGLPCVTIVVFLAWRHARTLRSFIATADSDERAYGKALLVASVGSLPIGWFHQVQQTPALWMLLGLGAALTCTRRV